MRVFHAALLFSATVQLSGYIINNVTSKVSV